MTAETCARRIGRDLHLHHRIEPLFDGSWLAPGTHLNLVGAFQPETREVDDVTVQAGSDVVVDTYDGALAEAGDC